MNKVHTYFKHKSSNTVIKDTAFLSKDREIRFINNEIKDNTVNTIRYRDMNEALVSNDFTVLSDYSFTENELRLLITTVSLCTNLNTSDEINSLLRKLTSLMYDRVYLPNDMNDVIK